MPNSSLPTPTPPPSVKPTVPAVSPQPVSNQTAVSPPKITAPMPSSPTSLPVKKSLTQSVNMNPNQPVSPQMPIAGSKQKTLPKRPKTSMRQQSKVVAPGKFPSVNSPARKPFPVIPSSGLTSGSAPVVAKAKKSPVKAVVFIVAAIVVLILAAFLIIKTLGGGGGSDNEQTTADGTVSSKPAKEITLTYWGLWEDETVFKQAFSDFEKENPGVTIVYKKQSPTDYRERLQTEISTGAGPDLFRFHASWVPMLTGELAVIPSKVISSNDYKATFYPVMVEQLQLNGQFVGIPLMYDGLVLLYNKDVLETAGVEPPTTWPDLQTLAKELTVPADRNSTNEIQRAGLAIGNANNVDHFSDILGLLILQNGGDPSQANSQQVQEALTYYTQFIKKDKVWSETLPHSTVAFAREEVVMIFAPSWRIHEIQALNPSLNFGVVSVPQLGDERIAWASYWAEGVNSKGKNQEMAWKLLVYLSGKEVMQANYSQQKQNRAFGEIYSRIDLADSVSADEIVSPFLSDAPYANNWYLNSMTHDKGLNDDLIKYYQDAITDMVENNNGADDVIGTVDLGTKQILRQYGLSK
jgi:multiple sugar transport system substrate-binding protein